jgi:hypothetical protein
MAITTSSSIKVKPRRFIERVLGAEKGKGGEYW